MKNNKLIPFILILAALASCLTLSSCEHVHTFGEIKHTEPTCLAEGYDYQLCTTCGYLLCTNTVPPTGHIYTKWEDDVRKLKKVSYCDVCGYITEIDDFTEPINIPRLYLYGTPVNMDIPVECRYSTTIDSRFSGIITLNSKFINHYDKQNYDLALYTDENYTTPLKAVFSDNLGKSSSYTLRAELIDKTLVRNIAASQLWYEAVRSRKNLPSELKKLPMCGSAGGFPALLYTNDNFNGIYSLCLANDENLFGLTGKNSILIYTYKTNNSVNFGYRNGSNDYLPAAVLYPKDQNQAEIAKNKFCEFTEFVNNCTNTEFRNGIDKYLDVDAAIDYLLCIYMFGADENVNDYCNWVSFDGKKFIPSMYNLSTTFGTDTTGYFKAAQNTLTPYYKNDILYSGTNSVLWQKLSTTFHDEITERYKHLRTKVLTEEKIESVFSSHIAKIPPEIYVAEFTQFPDKKLMNCPSTAQEIKDWYSQKCAILDKVLLK